MSNDTESLLRGGANEAAALAHRLASIRIESEHRLALYRSRSKLDRPAASPAQPEPPGIAHATPTLPPTTLRRSRKPGRRRERAARHRRRRSVRQATELRIASDFATSGAG